MKRKLYLFISLLLLVGVYFVVLWFQSMKTKQDMNEKFPFRFADLNYDNIEFEQNGVLQYKIIKSIDGYSVINEEGNTYVTDESMLSGFIGNMKSIGFQNLASSNPENKSEFEISGDTVLRLGSKEILVGASVDFRNSYIALKQGDKIYQIDKNLNQILNKKVNDFRSKNYKQLSGANNITLNYNDNFKNYYLSGQNWYYGTGVEADVDKYLDLTASAVISKDVSSLSGGNISYYSGGQLLENIDFNYDDSFVYMGTGDSVYRFLYKEFLE